MRIKILSKEGAELGLLDFDGGAKWIGKTDATLQGLLDEAGEYGVKTFREHRDGNTRILGEVVVPLSDPIFPLAFKKHLERLGYTVIIVEDTERALAEATELTLALPEGEEKRMLLEELPRMSYLEVTATIEILKKAAELARKRS